MRLEEFIERTSMRNSWIFWEQAEVYVRKHAWHGVNVFDIANLSSPEDTHRTGQFKRLVGRVGALLDAQLPAVWEVRVENVNNEHLCEHLIRTGWARTSETCFAQSAHWCSSNPVYKHA